VRLKSVGTRRPREGNSAKWSMAANPGKSCANVRSKVHRAGALYLANVRRIASLTLVVSTKKCSKAHTDRLGGILHRGRVSRCLSHETLLDPGSCWH